MVNNEIKRFRFRKVVMQMGNLLTPAEVAQQFRVTEATVRRWARDGEIASIKVGKTIRIPEESLMNLKNPSDHAAQQIS